MGDTVTRSFKLETSSANPKVSALVVPVVSLVTSASASASQSGRGAAGETVGGAGFALRLPVRR